ncbi:hypothetical protein [Lignipirellula cremea]|uniref:HEAT repeat protein n=1 Tax=Lignipirellula cremea TaxID=2528010 RepID=A0A518DS91_9BACT|nr:hypothetical protein [Lignipirellula cremea]QDU94704.1 hypothetical protein Pla8534_25100 [Lignipirellula cremea]
MFFRTLAASLAAMLFSFAPFAMAVDTADIEQWVRQLDSDQFAERQNASTELADAGVEAIPALEKAAQSGVREAVVRSIEILKRHFESDNAPVKEAAEKALKRLEDSPEASIARRAANALKPKEIEQPQAGAFGGIVVNGGGAIRIQIQQGGGLQRRVQIRNANGVKEIEAEENGRKVKIKEDANGIKVEITEKKGEKEETKTYEAKNLDELKQKHPDAYKAHQQYDNQQQGIQIRAFGANRQVLPMQIRPALPAAPNQQALPAQIQPAQRHAQAIARIRAMQAARRPGGEEADPLQSAADRLQEARKQLQGEAEQGGEKVQQELKPALESLDKAIERLGEAQQARAAQEDGPPGPNQQDK